jgi:hypothetical protein
LQPHPVGTQRRLTIYSKCFLHQLCLSSRICLLLKVWLYYCTSTHCHLSHSLYCLLDAIIVRAFEPIHAKSEHVLFYTLEYHITFCTHEFDLPKYCWAEFIFFSWQVHHQI